MFQNFLSKNIWMFLSKKTNYRYRQFLISRPYLLSFDDGSGSESLPEGKLQGSSSFGGVNLVVCAPPPQCCQREPQFSLHSCPDRWEVSQTSTTLYSLHSCYCLFKYPSRRSQGVTVLWPSRQTQKPSRQTQWPSRPAFTALKTFAFTAHSHCTSTMLRLPCKSEIDCFVLI